LLKEWEKTIKKIISLFRLQREKKLKKKSTLKEKRPKRKLIIPKKKWLKKLWKILKNRFYKTEPKKKSDLKSRKNGKKKNRISEKIIK
jgi:hypothetical protein